MRVLTLFSLFVLLASNTSGQVRLPSVIGSHMVLQQQSDVPLWGWAKPGERVGVKASWSGEVVMTTAGPGGDWMLRLRTPEAGGPYTIEISGRKTIILEDVLIGEVWLCSGQSNMEMPLRGWPEWGGPIDHSADEIAGADHPLMRLFTVPRKVAFEPQNDCDGGWSACTPETAKDFSATAYFFGRELHQKMNTPIGLIFTSWGGTPAEAWTSREFISRIPQFTTSPGELDARAFLQGKIEQYNKDLDRWTQSLGFSPDQPVPAWTDEPTPDDSWMEIPVPARWDSTLIGEYLGIVEYRTTFTVPDRWTRRDLILELGPIDEMDITWINGKLVGSHLLVSHWATPRVYEVPAGILREGENVLALRVANTSGIGGINGKPEALRIRPERRRTVWQPLAGSWKARKASEFTTQLAPPACIGCSEPNTPTTLYNGMIRPVIPYRIRGAIWYQGESNRYDGDLYKKIFPGMIANWRHDWNQGDFPFYFVQIAPYTYQDTWSTGLLREAQDYTMRTVPNTGMVVTMDIGDLRNIHPGNKQDVGRRLAYWALNKDYGYSRIAYTAPVYKSWQKEGNMIRISFEMYGQKLESKGGELSCFRIAGADRQFKPARAVIDNGTILVSSEEVPDPAAVRFAWESTDEPNLTGSSGLPVGQFRTDRWEE